MYGVKIEGDFQVISDAIDRMLSFREDLPSLGEEVASEIRTGNTEGLLQGTDKDGNLMPKTVRQQSGRLSAKYGGGEPLNPHGSTSRSIADFDVAVETIGDNAVQITSRWPNSPFFVYHKGPSGNRPARNIVGIRPETRSAINVRVQQWIERKLGGNS